MDRFDLDVEDVEYSSADQTKLQNHYEAGDVDETTYEFLRDGRRVEINAFAPTELKEYVETKLSELGVSKIEPDPDAVETPDIDTWEDTQRAAIENAIGRYVVDQIDDDLISALADRDDAVALPDDDERANVVTDQETVHEDVLDTLNDQPPKPWTEINDDVVDEIAEPAEAEQDDYKEAVKGVVADILADTDLVSVDPDALE